MQEASVLFITSSSVRQPIENLDLSRDLHGVDHHPTNIANR